MVVAAATAPEPALAEPAAVAAEKAAVTEWMFEEPARAAAQRAEPDLFQAKAEPATPKPPSYPAPAAYEEEPLFPEVHDGRRQPRSGGWFSRWGGGGRSRYDAPQPAPREPVRDLGRERPAQTPVPQARSLSSAQVAEEPKGDEGEDLNIPSFLRRLAN